VLEDKLSKTYKVVKDLNINRLDIHLFSIKVLKEPEYKNEESHLY